jgi:hypothetical protein
MEADDAAAARERLECRDRSVTGAEEVDELARADCVGADLACTRDRVALRGSQPFEMLERGAEEELLRHHTS